MQQYGINILEKDLHWHDFLALFYGLRETKINDIMSARYYTKPGKSKRDPMEEMREAWKLEALEEFKPEPFKMR